MSFDLNAYGSGKFPNTEDLIFGLKNTFSKPEIDPSIDLAQHQGFLPVSWNDPFDKDKRISGGVEVSVTINHDTSWEVLVSCSNEKNEFLLCWLIAATFATKGKGQLYDNQTGEAFEKEYALLRAYKEIKKEKLLPFSHDQEEFDKLKDALMSNQLRKLKKALKSSKNTYSLNHSVGFQILNYYMGGPHYFEYNPEEIIDLALDFGLSIEHNGAYTFTSALSLALGQRRLDIIKLLIEKGADVNFPSEQWNTPLHGEFHSYEGEDEEKEIIRLLVSAGADPYLTNHVGISPLDIATERIVKLDNGKGKKAHDLRPLLAELNISIDTSNQDFGIKLFWWDNQLNEGFATAEQAEVKEMKAAIECLKALTQTEGSFAGLVLTDDSVVQFRYDHNEKLRIDIPDIEKEGSHTKQLTLKEAKELIEQIYAGKDAKEIDGLTFDSWL